MMKIHCPQLHPQVTRYRALACIQRRPGIGNGSSPFSRAQFPAADMPDMPKVSSLRLLPRLEGSWTQAKIVEQVTYLMV